MQKKSQGSFTALNNTDEITTIQSVDQTNATVSSKISASSTKTQVIQADGIEELKGTTIAIPPGGLSIDTEIVVEEGTDLTSTSNTEALGLEEDQSLEPLGKSIVVSSTVPTDATGQLAISLPLPEEGSLYLDGDNLDKSLIIIIYKIQKASDGTYALGIIGNDQLDISGGKVSFKTKFFGSFQIAKAEKKIADSIEVKADTPILTKNQEKVLEKVTWAPGSATFSSAERKFIFKTSATGLQDISGCQIQVDKDKAPPFDKTHRQTSLSSFSMNATSGAKQSYYARYACLEENGRSSESPWFGPATQSMLSVSLNSATLREGVNTYENQHSVSISGSGLHSYNHILINISDTAATCPTSITAAKADINAALKLELPSPGSYLLCILGYDIHGNASPAATNISFEFLESVQETDNAAVALPESIPPGAISRAEVDATDGAFFYIEWESYGKQGNDPLSDQTVLIFADDSLCSGTPAATITVGNAATSLSFNRMQHSVFGNLKFQIKAKDLGGSWHYSACSSDAFVLSSQHHRLHGQADYHSLGNGVEFVDVTGDGIKDIISYSDNYNEYMGALTVIPGGNLSLSSMRIYSGEINNDGIGRNLKFADINGDGIQDIISSNPYAGNGTNYNSGSVFIILGAGSLPASGPISQAGIRYDGSDDNGYVGYHLSIADVNSDGKSDLIIGGNGVDYNAIYDSGALYVILGKSSLPTSGPLDSAADYVYYGAASGQIGGNYVKIGDVTGDGIADIVAKSGMSGSSSIHVIPGGTSLPASGDVNTTNGIFTITGSANEELGLQLGLADINGDGILDIYSQNQQSNPNGINWAGTFSVIKGGVLSSGSITAVGNQYYGHAASEQFTYNYKLADITGDGTLELISSTHLQGGIAYIVDIDLSTPTNGYAGNYGGRYIASSTSEISGLSNLTITDINGDGIMDVALSGRNHLSNRGIINIILGGGAIPASGGTATAANLVFTGDAAGDYFGDGIFTADLNGDGYGDLISYYGANFYVVLSESNGGLVSGPISAVGYRYTTGYVNPTFHSRILADVSGDGADDLIFYSSTTSANGYSQNGHTMLIISGQSLPAGGSIMESSFASITGEADYAKLASTIAIADHDGNGVLDIIVTSNQPGSESFVRALSVNQTDGSIESKTLVTSNNGFDSSIGGSLNFEDVTGDGLADFITSTSYYDGMDDNVTSTNGFSQNGSIYIMPFQQINP